MNRSRRVLLGAVLTTILTAGAVFASGPYQITGTVESRDGSLVRSEFVVQAGPSPLDRFKMIRLAKAGPGSPSRGSILFLPPLGTTFAFYEQRDPDGAFGSSIAEYFALRNFDVYGYSPRYEAIPAGTCEIHVLDCSVMAGWNLASMVDDITFVRSRIAVLHPGSRVVAGGNSLGGILALAVANAHPADYAGIFPWEAMLYSADPQVRTLNQGYCAAEEAQLAAGGVFDGLMGSVFKNVTQFAKTAPGGLNLIPLFPPDFTSHELFVALLSVPSPGPISMPVPNFVQMNGDPAEDRLFYASEPRVFESVLATFNNYIPVAISRDISCSLAGSETRYTNHLSAFVGPVLAIGGGHAFGPFMEDNLALLGTRPTDRTFLLQPGFGHIDHFMSAHHRDFVERPIFEWALRVFGEQE
jgi:pimeloyl-ACP methyl ester carboxylesterase